MLGDWTSISLFPRLSRTSEDPAISLTSPLRVPMHRPSGSSSFLRSVRYWGGRTYPSPPLRSLSPTRGSALGTGTPRASMSLRRCEYRDQRYYTTCSDILRRFSRRSRRRLALRQPVSVLGNCPEAATASGPRRTGCPYSWLLPFT